MAVVISLINQKGGVGKTTSAVTISHGAALRGSRVLLVDLDTQGNCAHSLGLDPAADLYHWLWDQLPISSVAKQARPGLDLIRSNKTTEALKLALTGRSFRELAIKSALEDYQDQYDFIFLDCAPSIDVLHTAAMVASNYLVIPARMDQLAVLGIREVTSTVAGLCKSGIHTAVAGIIPTMVERVTSESHKQLNNLVQNFGRLVWPAVPQDTVVREATRAGKSLWELYPNSKALVGYQADNGRVGGYSQVLDRLYEVCHA